MPDPHVLSRPKDKAHELRSAIVSYEEHLERTKRELAVVTATIAIVGRDGHLLTGNRPAARPLDEPMAAQSRNSKVVR